MQIALEGVAPLLRFVELLGEGGRLPLVGADLGVLDRQGVVRLRQLLHGLLVDRVLDAGRRRERESEQDRAQRR